MSVLVTLVKFGQFIFMQLVIFRFKNTHDTIWQQNIQCLFKFSTGQVTRDAVVLVLKTWPKISGFGLRFSNFVEDFLNSRLNVFD